VVKDLYRSQLASCDDTDDLGTLTDITLASNDSTLSIVLRVWPSLFRQGSFPSRCTCHVYCVISEGHRDHAFGTPKSI